MAARLVVATGNPGKLSEIRAALPGWEVSSVADLGGWDEPTEDGETFEDNARIKAHAARSRFGGAALADDSGLEVDALGGEPGVHSRYFAGGEATDRENNELLLRRLSDVPEGGRTARFRCVMVFVDRDGSEVVATGCCEGRIRFEPAGDGGFGYDPLFEPAAGNGRTMAQLATAEKNAISHRGAAVRTLKAALER